MQATSPLPDTFGPALRYLRKRSRLTQDELGRAVGYSREQIARLENGSRQPDLMVIAALFLPILFSESEQALTQQFLGLATDARRDQQITITHSKKTLVQIVQESLDSAENTSRHRHRPPAALLPLIGRTDEVRDLLAQLQTARLITLIGAPGIGKTRLALEVATLVQAQFADGVVFVSLAEVIDSADIPIAVQHHCSITPTPQQTPATAVRDYLTTRHLLLVLDNCEHLLDGATLFGAWLVAAPQLKILCTSRVPLDLYGEYEWSLTTLTAPDPASPHLLAQWAHFPALQLLVARARAVDSTFAVTAENVQPLTALCVALDGLPLALELAAVRLRDYDPAQLVALLLAERGATSLSSAWLQQTKRNIAERHRTLQAAIDWSVRLLPQTAQSSFARLGVFVGGGTAEAASMVAQADEALLTQLAHANLISYESGRIHLLETLRRFAEEQLIANQQIHATKLAHARYFTTFAQSVYGGLLGEDQATWMQRALAENDNCLAALRWALAERDGDMAVALAGGLWWFWTRRGFFALGREMLTAALALDSADLNLRAIALNGLASFCLAQEDYAANFAYHQAGLALRRQLNDTNGIATVLHNMGLTAYTMGDYAKALAWLKESAAVSPEGAQAKTSAWSHMGLIAQELQDLAQARHWLELAYEHTAVGWSQAFVMNYLADVLRESGDFARATELAQASLQLFTEFEDSYYLPDAQMTLAQISADQGAYETALSLAAIVYDQYAARDDPASLAVVVQLQAEIALNLGDVAQAATLFARVLPLRRQVKRALTPREQAAHAVLAQKIGRMH